MSLKTRGAWQNIMWAAGPFGPYRHMDREPLVARGVGGVLKLAVSS